MRRISTAKGRLTKASKRYQKMRALRIPRQNVKIRLVKGSIQTSSMWGIEANGMAPQRRQKARLALGRVLKLKTKGNVDIVFDQHPRHQDPGDLAMEKQLRVCHHLFQQWREELRSHLSSAWQATKERLDRATHRWQVVYGPMAALQAYLEEAKWQYHEFEKWTKQGDLNHSHLEIDLTKPWPTIREVLREDARRRRIQRISQVTQCDYLNTKLDWKITKAFEKQGSNNALLAK